MIIFYFILSMLLIELLMFYRNFSEEVICSASGKDNHSPDPSGKVP